MIRIHLALAAMLALCMVAPVGLAAGLTTEIFSLRHRTVDEIAPVVRPLVPPPGVVTGLGDQLIVKTDERTMASVRQILREIDTAPSNLLITVRQTMNEEIRRDLASVRGAVIRADSHRRRGDGQDEHRIRVLEGHEAFIHTGRSVPVREREIAVRRQGVIVYESTRHKDVGSGFYVRPSLRGDQATLRISPYRSRLRDRSGTIERTQSESVLTVALGSWTEVSTAGRAASGTGTAVGGGANTSRQSESSVYLKVERLH